MRELAGWHHGQSATGPRYASPLTFAPILISFSRKLVSDHDCGLWHCQRPHEFDGVDGPTHPAPGLPQSPA